MLQSRYRIKRLSDEITYLVIPCKVSVEDNGGSKTPGRIYASSCDRDGGQMNQENRESNGERSQNLHDKCIGIRLEHGKDPS